MRAAFVIGHSMDFIHDHGVYVTEDLTAFPCGKKNVERLRRCYQNMRRSFEHCLALTGKSVTGADGHAHLWHEQSFLSGQGHDLGQRAFQVFLYVIAQRFERGNIKDLRSVTEIAGEGSAHQRINTYKEGGKSLAGSSRCGY